MAVICEPATIASLAVAVILTSEPKRIVPLGVVDVKEIIVGGVRSITNSPEVISTPILPATSDIVAITE